MKHEDFFHLVERMRVAQKEYFRTRLAASLQASRRLEKDVDIEIERVNKVLHERRNPKMDF